MDKNIDRTSLGGREVYPFDSGFSVAQEEVRASGGCPESSAIRTSAFNRALVHVAPVPAQAVEADRCARVIEQLGDDTQVTIAVSNRSEGVCGSAPTESHVDYNVCMAMQLPPDGMQDTCQQCRRRVTPRRRTSVVARALPSTRSVIGNFHYGVSRRSPVRNRLIDYTLRPPCELADSVSVRYVTHPRQVGFDRWNIRGSQFKSDVLSPIQFNQDDIRSLLGMRGGVTSSSSVPGSRDYPEVRTITPLLNDNGEPREVLHRLTADDYQDEILGRTAVDLLAAHGLNTIRLTTTAPAWMHAEQIIYCIQVVVQTLVDKKVFCDDIYNASRDYNRLLDAFTLLQRERTGSMLDRILQNVSRLPIMALSRIGGSRISNSRATLLLDEDMDYTWVCDVGQLRASYETMPFGVYFVDYGYVLRVSGVSGPFPVFQFTDINIANIDAREHVTGFYIKGGVVGGRRKSGASQNQQHQGGSNKKKKKRMRIKKVKVNGGGAYGAPVSVQGSGKMSIRSIAKTVGKSRVSRRIGSAVVTSLLKGVQGQGNFTVPTSDPVCSVLVNNKYPMSHLVTSSNEANSALIKAVEYIGDIYNDTSKTLSGTQFFMNPGLAMFKLLSQTAANYTTYRPIQILVVFKSEVYSMRGSLGKILIYGEYNPNLPPLLDRFAIIDYHGAVACRCDEDCIMGIECDPSKTARMQNLLIRTTGVPAGTLSLYDFCTLNVYTDSIPADVVANGGSVGRLYVYYTVELFEYKLGTYLGVGIQQDVFRISNVTSPIIWNPPSLTGVRNNIGTTITATNQLTWPPRCSGMFMVYTVLNTSGGFTGSSVTYTYSGNIVPSNNNGWATNTSEITVISTANLVSVVYVNVTPATSSLGNRITLNFTGSYTGTANIAVYIMQLGGIPTSSSGFA